MNNISRQKLNDRFKTVYRELVGRKEIIKNDRQKSKSSFANKMGTKGHIVDLYLQGKREITYEQAKQLCINYNINQDYMFQGIGQPFGKVRIPGPEQKLAMALGINFSPNILFTNIEAFSSNTIGVDLLEENERFAIPGMNGDLIAFNINGDSMAPTILSGDMVICSPLEGQEEVSDNEIYAVVSNQSVWVKRVQKCFDRHHNWTHLKLISDNHLEYDPFLIEAGEVRKLLKVTKRLTGMG